MSRLICLAQAHAVPKRAGSKSARAAKDAPALSFTVLERAPLRLASHKPIWDVLRKHATRQSIVDDAHPEASFDADVVLVDQLGAEAVLSVASVLAERRAMALAAEKDAPGSDILGKRLDRLFEQEMEWLAVRNLLAAALPRASEGRSKRRKPQRRALLLVGG
ncbi:MAG: hypothetical protein ACK4TP_05675 [Hyphomicrobium sp.]|jgi:hypothetical protein